MISPIFDHSTRHFHNVEGIELLNAEGSAVQLFPPAWPGQTYHGMGMIFSLKALAGVSTANNLLLERWLFRADQVRATILPTSGDLQVVFGHGGDTSNQTMTYDRAAMQAAGWTVEKPQQLVILPISAVLGTMNNTPNASTGFQLRASLNGVLLPEKTRTVGGPNPTSFMSAIGGGTGNSYSDMVVFEFFLMQGNALSQQQQQAMYNKGQGASIHRLGFLGETELRYLLRFSHHFYTPLTRSFAALVGTNPAQLFSVTYDADYEIKTKLKLDGVSTNTVVNRFQKGDRLNRTNVAVDTNGYNVFLNGVTARNQLYLVNGTAGHNAFTYEVDAQPLRVIGLTGLTQASTNVAAPGGFNGGVANSFLPGNYRDLSAFPFELTPFCFVGTDGIIAGLIGLTTFGNRVCCIQLVWQAAGNLSSSQLSRMALMWDERKPFLYKDANLVKEGVLPPAEMQPGAMVNNVARAWPIRPYLQFAENNYQGNEGIRGGNFYGYLANIKLYSEARHAYLTSAGTAANKANPSTLELCWDLTDDRTGPAGSANGPTSLIINDTSGKGRHGVLTNYDLTPVSPQHRQRRGRIII